MLKLDEDNQQLKLLANNWVAGQISFEDYRQQRALIIQAYQSASFDDEPTNPNLAAVTDSDAPSSNLANNATALWFVGGAVLLLLTLVAVVGFWLR